MVSVDTDGSSGATGIAWDADIAIRPRPLANTKTPSIFMDFSFPLQLPVQQSRTYPSRQSANEKPALPVAAAPVPAMPAAAMPAPMAATPAPVTAAPAPVTPVPAHLFGLQMSDLVPGGNGGTGIFIRRRRQPVFLERMRRKRRGLRARGERGRARGKSNGEFQKVSAFHDIFSIVHGE
jgi:hypothetical protein